eukprot:115751-Chlamydomonas_euryale.AAC.2
MSTPCKFRTSTPSIPAQVETVVSENERLRHELSESRSEAARLLRHEAEGGDGATGGSGGGGERLALLLEENVLLRQENDLMVSQQVWRVWKAWSRARVLLLEGAGSVLLRRESDLIVLQHVWRVRRVWRVWSRATGAVAGGSWEHAAATGERPDGFAARMEGAEGVEGVEQADRCCCWRELGACCCDGRAT